MTLIGAGCGFSHRKDSLIVRDPDGQVLFDATFMSIAAARHMNQELAQLIRNMMEDRGTEDMRRLLGAEVDAQ